MSYHFGLDVSPGVQVDEPHIRCDTCNAKRPIVTNHRDGPPIWFLGGRPPPRWTSERTAHGRRLDWCPECTARRKALAWHADE